MKSSFIFLFLFSFFLLFNLSSVSADVVQIGSINTPIYLAEGTSTSYYFNNYYSGYDFVDIVVSDVPMAIFYGDFISRTFSDAPYCVTANHTLSVCLVPLFDNFRLDIRVLSPYYSPNSSYLISLDALNSSTSNMSGIGLEVYVEGISIDLNQSDNFLIYWTAIFLNLFPSSENLTTSQKFGFVFIVILVVTGLIYFVGYKTGGINKFIHWIVFLLDGFLFLFFIAIGFIPIVILVVCGCILIALTYFKIKAGG